MQQIRPMPAICMHRAMGAADLLPHGMSFSGIRRRLRKLGPPQVGSADDDDDNDDDIEMGSAH
jgi:hypothetical protein